MKIRRVKVSPVKSDESKPFRALQFFFKILHILFCLDFGFFEHESKKKRYFWKVATVLNAIFLMCFTYIYFDDNDNKDDLFFWMSFYYCHYFVNVFALIFISPTKTFCQLHRDLHAIDVKLGTSSVSFQIEKKIIALIIFELANSLITNQLYVMKNEESPAFIFYWLVVTINIVHLCCAFVFYSILRRLSCFSSTLKSYCRRDNLSLQNIYKTIVDLTELHKTTIDPLILASILFSTFEVMASILYLVQDMKLENSITFRVEFISVLTSLAYMFSPALCADYLSSQAEKIILILHEKVLQEKDSGRQRELERFIRYVKARPLQFRVYRLIPLDASLLCMVISFAVTYLIVIIQFTYK